MKMHTSHSAYYKNDELRAFHSLQLVIFLVIIIDDVIKPAHGKRALRILEKLGLWDLPWKGSDPAT